MAPNLWIARSCVLRLAVVSAVVPWVNAEVLMLSAGAGGRVAAGARSRS
jgi:hypothetical protein